MTWTAYWLYFKSAGIAFVVSVILWSITYSTDLGAFLWLQYWADNSGAANASVIVVSSRKGISVLGLFAGAEGQTFLNLNLYKRIYASDESFLVVIGIFAFYFGVLYAIKASTVLHDRLLASVFRAPITFFDVTPVGRYVLSKVAPDVSLKY